MLHNGKHLHNCKQGTFLLQRAVAGLGLHCVAGQYAVVNITSPWRCVIAIPSNPASGTDTPRAAAATTSALTLTSTTRIVRTSQRTVSASSCRLKAANLTTQQASSSAAAKESDSFTRRRADSSTTNTFPPTTMSLLACSSGRGDWQSHFEPIPESACEARRQACLSKPTPPPKKSCNQTERARKARRSEHKTSLCLQSVLVGHYRQCHQNASPSEPKRHQLL